MSSHLDRAFVKAYTRSLHPTPAANVAVSHLTADDVNAASLKNDLPRAPQGSMQWSEFADESYFRVDVGHGQPMRANVAPPSSPMAAALRSQPLPPSPQRAMATTSRQPLLNRSIENVVASDEQHERSLYNQGSTTFAQAVSPTMSSQRPATAASLPAEPVSMPFARDSNAAWEHEFQAYDSRVDDAHGQHTWTPPGIDEPQEYYRVPRDVAQAEAFARAKMTALASESTFTSRQPSQPIVTPARGEAFEPIWEVDAFEFSDTIVALFGDAKLMKSIGTPLDRAVSMGLRSLLVTSGGRCEGRTSVAVGIAVSAAAAGLKVALVEADNSEAGFAATLQMEVQHDWVEAIRNGIELGEVAIHSIEDQLTALPIVPESAQPPYTAAEFDCMLSQLRQSFDLIVVDGAPWWDTPHPLRQATAIDAAILVVDARHGNHDTIQRIQSDLRGCGVAGLGIVENFI